MSKHRRKSYEPAQTTPKSPVTTQAPRTADSEVTKAEQDALDNLARAREEEQKAQELTQGRDEAIKKMAQASEAARLEEQLVKAQQRPVPQVEKCDKAETPEPSTNEPAPYPQRLGDGQLGPDDFWQPIYKRTSQGGNVRSTEVMVLTGRTRKVPSWGSVLVREVLHVRQPDGSVVSSVALQYIQDAQLIKEKGQSRLVRF